jgi:preprotein translocase subunit Sec63
VTFTQSPNEGFLVAGFFADALIMASMEEKLEYYSILGVDRAASPVEIRAAYKKLALVRSFSVRSAQQHSFSE